MVDRSSSFTPLELVCRPAVSHSRGKWCVDIELVDFVVDDEGHLNMIMDLRLTHHRCVCTSNPVLIDTLHYPRPVDIEKPLHDDAAKK